MKTVLKSVLALAAGLVMVLAYAAPQVGDSAPDFRLQDQNNQWHALEDYAGQWLVVYFYPKADTPGCTTEACEFRDNIFAFEDRGVAVLGVSVDDVASQKEFSEKYHLPFPLLSDARQEVAASYGVLRTFGNMAIADRQTFVINPDGRIAKHYGERQVNPETHTREVLTDLEDLM